VAGAAMLLCSKGAIVAVITGRVDDAVTGGGGVAPDDGIIAPSPGDDGAWAGPSGGKGPGDPAFGDGARWCALVGGMADVRPTGACAGARCWRWRPAPVHGASATDAAGAASTAAKRRAVKVQSLPRAAMAMGSWKPAVTLKD